LIAASILKRILLSRENHIIYIDNINTATKRDSLEKIFFQSIKKIDAITKRYILSSNRWLPKMVKKRVTKNRWVFQDMIFCRIYIQFPS